MTILFIHLGVLLEEIGGFDKLVGLYPTISSACFASCHVQHEITHIIISPQERFDGYDYLIINMTCIINLTMH